MKASKEIRKWINRGRSKHAKKNGVLGRWFFDAPNMDRKIANNKHRKNPRINK